MAPTEPHLGEAELCLHLAGGTVEDLVRLGSGGSGWHEAASDEWVRRGLAAERAERLARLLASGATRRELDGLQRLGGRLVGWKDPGYPIALLALPQPPIALAVVGRWPTPELAIAVVGARAATAYGRLAARRLAGAAHRNGIAIVSGLARGIDRCALEAALPDGGWPIAVLGCGPDVAYPPEHRALQALIAGRGTIVSEFPLGTHPSRYAFPRRNRIIAALSRLVLVVEAGAKSGALITSQHAQELGKDVLAVPGPIDSEASRGTNKLIYDGASPAIDEEHLLWAVAAAAPRRPPAEEGGEDVLLRRPVLAALGSGALSADELAIRAGLGIPETRSQLIGLELEGLVQRIEGGLFALRGLAGRPARPAQEPTALPR